MARHRIASGDIGIRATWVVLAVVALALRLPDIGNPLIDLDEQFYLLVGDRMLHGAIPYVDIWDRKPIGLFLIYAAARAVGGNPWVGYQLFASVAALVTAGTIARLTRRIASGWAGLAAGATYLCWIAFLGGRGGQSPVFYDALVAGAALLTVRAGGAEAVRWRDGLGAMLLCGVALQIKPTTVFEGCWFGIALLISAARAGWRWPRIGGYAAALVATALFPTVIAVAAYAGMGHADAWWFANVESIFRRGIAAAEPVGARVTGIALMLLVPAAVAVVGAARLHGSARWFLVGWTLVALSAVAAIPPYYNHYALPLIVPIAILTGVAMAASRALAMLVGVVAVGLLVLSGYPHGGERAGARDAIAGMRATIDRYRGRGCMVDLAGVPALYVATGSCLPTRYAFAPHLMLASEAGAIGVDQHAEIARILAARPPVVVIGPPPGVVSRAPVALARRIVAHAYRRVGGARGYAIYALRPLPADTPRSGRATRS